MAVGMITVRAFTAGDVPAVLELEQACQPTPWSEGVFMDELAADNRSYLVAEERDVIGFGGVMVVGIEAHVTNLLVAPEQRRRGVGRKLMEHLIGAGLGLGAKHLTLEVRAANTGAIALYRGLGLAPVGVRPGYYGDDDALIMWAHDLDQRASA